MLAIDRQCGQGGAAGDFQVVADQHIICRIQVALRPIGLARDFLLNRHRTPRGASLFWVFGLLFVGLGASYWVMEARRLRLRWLVILGQTALFLYFVHQVIALMLVNHWLGWRFNQRPRFWLANAVFVLALVGLGWAWREARPRLRTWLTRWSPFVRTSPTGSAS